MPNSHLLTVAYDEAGVAEYQIQCPGLPAACEAFVECMDGCDADELDRLADAGDDEPSLHGVPHRQIDGDWTHPTGECFIANHPDLVDAARFLDLPHSGGELHAGSYEVVMGDHAEPTGLVLELASTDARPNSAAAESERPWCGARKELGGQQPCPLKTPCDERTCRIGSADGSETYKPNTAPNASGGEAQ